MAFHAGFRLTQMQPSKRRLDGPQNLRQKDGNLNTPGQEPSGERQIPIQMKGPRLLLLRITLTSALVFGAALVLKSQFAASDPGVRSGPPGAGGPLPGLSASAYSTYSTLIPPENGILNP